MSEGSHVSRRRWAWRLGWLSLLIVALFGDVWLSKLVFHSLCASEGGEEIYKVVSNVEGLLLDFEKNIGCDPRCKELLGNRKYRFVEMKVDAPNRQFLVSAAGTYRFYLTERGQPECAAYERWFAGNQSYREATERQYEIPSSKCIAAVQVTQPISLYAYVKTQDDYVKELGIRRFTDSIKEIGTGNLLARNISFTRANGWIVRISGTHPENQTCYPGDGLLTVKALRPAAG